MFPVSADPLAITSFSKGTTTLQPGVATEFIFPSHAGESIYIYSSQSSVRMTITKNSDGTTIFDNYVNSFVSVTESGDYIASFKCADSVNIDYAIYSAVFLQDGHTNTGIDEDGVAYCLFVPETVTGTISFTNTADSDVTFSKEINTINFTSPAGLTTDGSANSTFNWTVDTTNLGFYCVHPLTADGTDYSSVSSISAVSLATTALDIGISTNQFSLKPFPLSYKYFSYVVQQYYNQDVPITMMFDTPDVPLDIIVGPNSPVLVEPITGDVCNPLDISMTYGYLYISEYKAEDYSGQNLYFTVYADDSSLHYYPEGIDSVDSIDFNISVLPNWHAIDAGHSVSRKITTTDPNLRVAISTRDMNRVSVFNGDAPDYSLVIKAILEPYTGSFGDGDQITLGISQDELDVINPATAIATDMNIPVPNVTDVEAEYAVSTYVTGDDEFFYATATADLATVTKAYIDIRAHPLFIM
ncbi:hypothetical protein ADUPG1_011787, partial [Aduncisulcus paluster]